MRAEEKAAHQRLCGKFNVPNRIASGVGGHLPATHGFEPPTSMESYHIYLYTIFVSSPAIIETKNGKKHHGKQDRYRSAHIDIDPSDNVRLRVSRTPKQQIKPRHKAAESQPNETS
jgi:hypothetical protein